MKKKILSLALTLVMCLGLTVPAFAAESKWKLEVPGKNDAEVRMGKKTVTLRDCGVFDFDDTGALVFIKDDDRHWTAENVCVLSRGDTAVFTYKHEVSTGHGGVFGSTIGSSYFNLIAWSDPDGDGVYDKRAIIEGDYDNKKNGYYELLPENCFEEVLPAGIDVSNVSLSMQRQSSWLAIVNPDEDARYEARLSADRVLELFGPNTLVGINNEGIFTSDPADIEWFILVEGDTAQPTEPTKPSFTDVKTGDYYAEPVAWAVEKKITAGTSATTFSPNATCTQGQILTLLWRAKGEPKPSGTVSGTQYYATAAQWAKEQGLTDAFSASADCTRAMVVTYLWKLAGSPKTGMSAFTDVPANADYAQAVAWALEQGITGGTSASTFSPDNVCTRGQIVTFLYRAFAK